MLAHRHIGSRPLVQFPDEFLRGSAAKRRAASLPQIRSTYKPLRLQAFRRLLGAYTINSIGDYVGLVALAVLVYAETRNALATTALFVCMQFIPAFLAPALTAKLDQTSLRITLPVLYGSEALLFSGLAVLAKWFSLPAVLVLAAVDGVMMLTVRGLSRGAANSILQPSGQLRDGNALLNVGFAFANVGGAALGGLLVGAFSASFALVVNACSFAIAAVLLAATTSLPAAGNLEREPFWERVQSGLRYARTNRVIRLLLAGEGVAMVLFTVIVPIEVIYAEVTLDAGVSGFGFLLSAWGAGVVLGSFIFLRVNARSSAALILISTSAIGIAYLGMAGARELWLACAFSIVGGLGNGIQWVSVVTAIQEATPDDLQARTVGLLESIGSVMTGVGFILGGVITSFADPPLAFIIAGAGTLLLVLVAMVVRLLQAADTTARSEA